MTGYTVHTGTSEKFAAGWDQIFSSKPAKKSGDGKSKKAGKAKAAKAKSGKKKSGRKVKHGK